MTTTPLAPAPIKGAKTPKVGIVSLGCPKALVDSERILTQLRTEGYAVSPTYAGADIDMPQRSSRDTAPTHQLSLRNEWTLKPRLAFS